MRGAPEQVEPENTQIRFERGALRLPSVGADRAESLKPIGAAEPFRDASARSSFD